MAAITEVARRAGVSTMSVSRVLNNSPQVSDATRARVLQAIAELDYTPNVAARTLKRGRSKSVGVLVPPSDNPIYSRYAAGIADTAYAAGYSVVLCRKGSGQAGEAEILRLLREERVPGVITTAATQAHLVAQLRSDFQIVTIDGRAAGFDRVSLDNADAMDRAVGHLARLGHRRIGMITGPFSAPSEPERLVGYRRAMRRRDLPLQRRLQAVAAAFTDDGGVAAANSLLRCEARPTALIVSSSALTPGVLIAISAARLRVPEDIAMVGVGEMSWSPTLVSPITSLVEPAYEMGAEGCRLLLERLDGRLTGPPCHTIYPARLAIRLSCGAPPEQRDVPLNTPASLLFCSATPASSE